MTTLYKNLLFLALMLVVTFSATAQCLNHIDLKLHDTNASIQNIVVKCDSMTLIVDPEGNVALRPVGMSNIDYYTHADGAYREGKLKALDTIVFDYYDNFTITNNAGKLKSVGPVTITYYDQFDSFDNIGKVKSIGNITFTYNEKADGFDNLGKLRSVGDIKITYYDRFDGGDNIGKLRSVGNTQFAWFTRFDGGEHRIGKLRSVKGDTPYLHIIQTELRN